MAKNWLNKYDEGVVIGTNPFGVPINKKQTSGFTPVGQPYRSNDKVSALNKEMKANKLRWEQERKQARIDLSEKAKEKPFFSKERWTPESIAQETGAIGDKLSLQNLPIVGDYVPDMLDATGWIGNMGSGLGRIPQNIQQGNYGQAAGAVLEPILAGAVMSAIGGPQTNGQFINNMVNPAAGFNVGKGLQKIGTYLTEETALKNAWKINPYSNKGTEGFIDLMRIQEKGALPQAQLAREKKLNISFLNNENTAKWFDKREQHFGEWFTNDPKDIDWYKTDRAFENPEIINLKVPNSTINNYSATNLPSANELSFAHDREFIIPKSEQNNFKPDWLQGYKQIEVPKNNLQSEIIENIPSNSSYPKEQEDFLHEWFKKDRLFRAMPESTNTKSLEVLDNFKIRAKSKEGIKRLKDLGIDEGRALQDINILEDANTYGYYAGDKNKIVMHPEASFPNIIVRHEAEHAVQQQLKNANLKKILDNPNSIPLQKLDALKSGTTPIDDLLSGLDLKKEGTPNKVWIKNDNTSPVDINNYKTSISNKQKAVDYFLTGSEGREKSAFLGEVQEYMMSNNTIPKDSYVNITPEMVKNTFVDAMFDESKGGKYLRLFNIMKASDKNYDLVAKGLNKMITPTAITAGTVGIGAATQKNKAKEQGYEDGGWLNKYAEGGEVELEEDPLKKINDKKPVDPTAYYKNKVYKGPKQFQECVGEGCAKQVSKDVANLFGVNYNEISTENAWYKRADVLKSGGAEVWDETKGKLEENYANFKIGDIVSLSRGTNSHKTEQPQNKKLTLADNENVEHVGYVIGYDAKGVPMIKHGHQGNAIKSAKSYVQPITNLSLDDIGLKYKVKSAYRSKVLINNESEINQKYYKDLEPVKNLKFKPDANITEEKKKFIDAYNKHSESFQLESGLNAEDVAAIGNVAYGIFGNESSFNKMTKKDFPYLTKNAFRHFKLIGADFAHAFGRDAASSVGPTQIKYDDAVKNADKSETKTGRLMKKLDTRKGGLANYFNTNYNDVTKATFAKLAGDLEKLKTKKQYNYDPETNTVFGNVPIQHALSRMWVQPSIKRFEKSLQKGDSSYSNAVVNNTIDLEPTSFTNNLKEVSVVGKKEDGGWLNKYN